MSSAFAKATDWIIAPEEVLQGYRSIRSGYIKPHYDLPHINRTASIPNDLRTATIAESSLMLSSNTIVLSRIADSVTDGTSLLLLELPASLPSESTDAVVAGGTGDNRFVGVSGGPSPVSSSTKPAGELTMTGLTEMDPVWR